MQDDVSQVLRETCPNLKKKDAAKLKETSGIFWAHIFFQKNIYIPLLVCVGLSQYQLVGGFNPSENISQIRSFP